MPAAKSKQVLGPGRRVRILVVDDSIAVRHLVALALEDDPLLEVVGTAGNGREALERLSSLAPDVVTLDIEMPEMDGLEALRNMRHLAPQVRVVMLSMFTERGAAATIEALTAGADDYVTKVSPGKSIEESKSKLRRDLGPKIKQFFAFPDAPAAGSVQEATQPDPVAISRPPSDRPVFIEHPPRVVAIGISTGGPTALASIIHQFPPDFRLPILIVQHMPPMFTKLLCERLQDHANLEIREAISGEAVKPGTILVAPGDYHMRVVSGTAERYPRIVLDQAPPENSCRPAVDVLFQSLANVYGGGVVAAVMTGMGQDGLRGAKILKKAGAKIFAQDEKTSAVWGMPRAVAEANIAEAVLPLMEIIPKILLHCIRHSPSHKPGIKATGFPAADFRETGFRETGFREKR